jgi:hypothetical protein
MNIPHMVKKVKSFIGAAAAAPINDFTMFNIEC